MMPLLVCAPNYPWARTEMREMFPELRPVHGWRYCSSPRDLMGLSERAVVVVFSRPNYFNTFDEGYWWQLMLKQTSAMVVWA